MDCRLNCTASVLKFLSFESVVIVLCFCRRIPFRRRHAFRYLRGKYRNACHLVSRGPEARALSTGRPGHQPKGAASAGTPCKSASPKARGEAGRGGTCPNAEGVCGRAGCRWDRTSREADGAAQKGYQRGAESPNL